jgi:hypothetical protein
MLIRHGVLLALLIWPTAAYTQEVKYIDLTTVQQRKELRRPPAPPPTDDGCKGDSNCIGTGSGGGVGANIADGVPDPRDPRALGIYVLDVYPSDIDPAKPFAVEFKVLNTGTVPLSLPVSPHLSDLQPDDPATDFKFFGLSLLTRVGVSTGYAELFGAPEHPETMITVHPGEWLRVKANITLLNPPSERGLTQLNADFSLHSTKFHASADFESTVTTNLYPNSTPTPPKSVWFLAPSNEQRGSAAPRDCH